MERRPTRSPLKQRGLASEREDARSLRQTALSKPDRNGDTASVERFGRTLRSNRRPIARRFAPSGKDGALLQRRPLPPLLLRFRKEAQVLLRRNGDRGFSMRCGSAAGTFSPHVPTLLHRVLEARESSEELKLHLPGLFIVVGGLGSMLNLGDRSRSFWRRWRTREPDEQPVSDEVELVEVVEFPSTSLASHL